MRHKNATVFYIMLFLYTVYSIFKAYGFTYFPDEFGYWSYAARMAGYDWSNITSMGSYYSYGYSLILFFIFKIFKDSVVAYRVAVGTNLVLIGLAYLLLSRLVCGLAEVDKDKSYIITAVAMFYPPLLFYGKSTMVEALLAIMYIIIGSLIYSYVVKGKNYTLVGIILSLVYIHFVHMRAIGILIAGIITLIVYWALKKENVRKLAIILCGAAVILAIGFALKEAIMYSVYNGDSSVSDINDYAGQIYKVKYIFTRGGIKDFAVSLAGKLLYMGLSTFGLAWFGIVYSIKKIVGIRESKHNVVHIFILISTIAEVFISAIYNINPIRVDNLTYGRYHEFVFPVLIAFGLCEIIDMKAKVKISLTAGIILVQSLFTYIVTQSIERYGLTNLHGYVMAGISYLYNSENYEPVKFMWQAYAFGIAFTILIIVISLIKKDKIKNFLLIGFVVIELILAIRVSTLFTDAAARGTYRDLTIAAKIESLLSDGIDNRRILYITDEENSFISVLQFMLRDEEITLLPLKGSIEEYTREEMNENDILVLFYRSSFTDEAEKMFSLNMLNGHFYVYYNKP